MSETQTQYVDNPEHEQRREPLTDEHMGELLAGVGNSEGKALLLLAMGADSHGANDKYQTRLELHGLIKHLPGLEQANIGTKSNQHDWCTGSLAPIGLVAKADYASPVSYAISEEGRELGVPLAALLLDFSEKYSAPLVELFGESMSATKSRSSMVRLSIIQEILTHPQVPSLSELMAASGVTRNAITRSLRKLDAAGLLDYENWDYAVNSTRYQLIEKSYEPASYTTEVGKIAVGYMKLHPDVTLDELVDYCVTQQPGTTRKKVATYLKNLENRGVVKHVESLNPNQPVNVHMTEAQHTMWSELLEKLEAFRTQDPAVLAGLRARAAEILQSPDFIKNAYERYISSSSRSKVNGDISIGQLVMDVLHESDSPLSNREIVKRVTEKRGKAVSEFGVMQLLKKHVDTQTVQVDEGRAYGYSLSTSKD